jgi:hypothetical protein
MKEPQKEQPAVEANFKCYNSDSTNEHCVAKLKKKLITPLPEV